MHAYLKIIDQPIIFKLSKNADLKNVFQNVLHVARENQLIHC